MSVYNSSYLHLNPHLNVDANPFVPKFTNEQPNSNENNMDIIEESIGRFVEMNSWLFYDSPMKTRFESVEYALEKRFNDALHKQVENVKNLKRKRDSRDIGTPKGEEAMEIDTPKSVQFFTPMTASPMDTTITPTITPSASEPESPKRLSYAEIARLSKQN